MTPEQFKDIRAQLGVTQMEMTLLLGFTSQNHVSALENGRATIIGTVAVLMRVYADIGYDRAKQIQQAAAL